MLLCYLGWLWYVPVDLYISMVLQKLVANFKALEELHFFFLAVNTKYTCRSGRSRLIAVPYSLARKWEDPLFTLNLRPPRWPYGGCEVIALRSRKCLLDHLFTLAATLFSYAVKGRGDKTSHLHRTSPMKLPHLVETQLFLQQRNCSFEMNKAALTWTSSWGGPNYYPLQNHLF
jgi:hypothetical protein